MNLSLFLQDFAPCVGFIGVGYALARFTGVNVASLATVLRFALLPPLLFVLLVTRTEPAGYGITAALGAAMAVVGWLLVTAAPSVLKPKVDASAAVPNVACFALPILALGWASVGLGTAAALFVGVMFATVVVHKRGAAAGALVGEPWLWAALLALVFQIGGLPTETIAASVWPLAAAAFPLALLYLGASMFPLGSFRDASAWATVGVRYAAGISVALTAIVLLPMTAEVKEALVLVAFAPPATGALALARPAKERDTARAAATIGVAVSIVIVLGLDRIAW